MVIKRLGAASVWLCFAAMLGACAPFSGFVADHVPHWAGGLPPDAPPRPGAPGYDDFIAHGEPAQTAATPPSGAASDAAPAAASTGAIPSSNAAATNEPQFQARNAQAPSKQPHSAKAQRGHARPVPSQASAQRPPQAAAPDESAEAPATEDQSVVKGGLY
jgi:hypothetical protein